MNIYTRITVAACVVAGCLWPLTGGAVICERVGLLCAACNTVGNCTAVGVVPHPVGLCRDGQVCQATGGGTPACVASAGTPCACTSYTLACDPYDNATVNACVSEDFSPNGYAPQPLLTCPFDQPCMGGRCVTPTTNSTTTNSTTTSSTTTSPTTTTKPATCALANVGKRYRHETDCKKYYTCREVTRGTYRYVESTCPFTYKFNSEKSYCDLPDKVTCQ